MYSYIKFADTLSSSMGKAFSWCIVILMGGTCYEVIMAYAFNAPTLWNFDFSLQMYGAIFMMAGAYTLATEAHVRGDVIYRLFPTKVQGWIDLILYFIFFFPGVLALAVTGFKYAARSVRYGEVSINSPAGIPIFQFKAIIVLAGVLLVIQGIAQVLRCVHCMRHGSWYETKETDEVEETEVILKRQQQQPSREQ